MHSLDWSFIERILGEESTGRLLVELEEKAKGDDPYRVLAQESRRMGERLLRPEAQETLQRLSRRLVMPVERTESRTLGSFELSSGWISRPTIRTYKQFLEQENVQLALFQVQETTTARLLLDRSRQDVKVITQRLRLSGEQDKKEEDRVAASILAGNELTRMAADPQRVRAVHHPYTFHLKLGSNEKQAYIATQNLTPALGRNNSFESMLLLNQESPFAAERELAKEIKAFLDWLLPQSTTDKRRLTTKMLSEQPRQAYARIAKQTSEERRGLFVNEEILPMLERLVKELERKKKDRMIISMGEISLLSKQKQSSASEFVSSIFKGLESGRIEIITDRTRLDKAIEATLRLKELQSKPSRTEREETELRKLEQEALSENVLKAVAQGRIRPGLYGYHHDKAFAVFGDQLKALVVGSANLSEPSLLPLAERSQEEKLRILRGLGFAEEEINRVLSLNAEQVKERLKGTGLSTEEREILDVLSSPAAVEAVAVLSSSEYKLGRRNKALVDASDYLSQIQKDVRRHFEGAAGRLGGVQLTSGRIQSKATPQVSEQVLVPLLRKLKETAEKSNGFLEVWPHYESREGKITLVEIEVYIKSATLGGRVLLVLSATQDNNIVIVNKNKIIAGSVVINNSENRILSLSIGNESLELKPGQSITLNAVDTAVAVVTSIARRVRLEELYEEPSRWYLSKIYEREGRLKILQSVERLMAQTLVRVDVKGLLSGVESIEDVLLRLEELPEEDRKQLLQSAITDLSQGLSSGIALTDKQIEERRKAFTPYYHHGTFDSGKVIRLLDTSIGRTVASDILLRLYLEEALQSPAARVSLRRATKAAVDSIVDAFLPTSQLGYSGMQGKYRVPVLQIEPPRRGFSRAEDELFKGTVGPAPFSHATPLQGAYVRLMNATAHERPKSLTPAGTYRFLEVEDRSLTQGAASVYLERVFESVVGLSILNLKDEEVKKLLEELGIEHEGKTLYRFPYAASRTDQLPARLKNLLGGRPLADISQQALEYALSLGTQKKPNDRDIVSGRILPLLPKEQAEIVKAEVAAIRAEHPNWSREAVWQEATRRLRQKQFQPESTLGGIIGGSRPRRIALTLGGNLLGDYNLGNADYFQPVGQLSTLKVTFSVQNDDQLRLIEQVSRFLSQDTFFLPAERTINIGGTLRVFEPGVYKVVDGTPQRIAGFDLEGRVVVGETTQPWGDVEVIEKITMKVPVFGKRFNENAIGWIPGNQVAISRTGSRVTLETEVWTFFETDSTHRQGFGPFKNLMNLVQGGFFEALEKSLPGTFRILDKQAQPLYALVSPSTLKGHVFQTGAEILVRKELRKQIQRFIERDTQKAAAALAVSFADKDLKKALVAYLRQANEPRVLDVADALERSKVKGMPDRESVLTAPGMMTLGGRLKGNYQEIAAAFREVLSKALQGDAESLALLRQGLLETLSRGAEATDELGVVIQGDPVTYGAAAMVELLSLGRQIVEGPKSKYGSQPRRLEDWKRFLKDRDHSHIVRSLAAVVGVDLTAPDDETLKGRLQFLASRMDSLISIEMLVEGLPSSSLVTMGSEREVDVEFHTLMSLGQLTLDTTIPRFGKRTVAEEIRRTFTVLSSLNLITGQLDLSRSEVPPVLVAFSEDTLEGRPALIAIAESRERALLTLPGVNERAMAQQPEIGKKIFQAVNKQYRVRPEQQAAIRAAMATLAGIDENNYNWADIAALSPTGIEDIDARISQHIAQLLGVEAKESAPRLLGRALAEVAKETKGDIRIRLREAEPESLAGRVRRVFELYPELEKNLFTPMGPRAILLQGEIRRPKLHEVGEAIRAVEVAMEKTTAQAIARILKLPSTLGKQFSAAMARSQDPVANLNIRLVLPALESQEGEEGIRVRIGHGEWAEGLIMGREMMEVLPLTYTGSTQHEALTHQVEIAGILSKRKAELEAIRQAALRGDWSPPLTPEAFADIERLRELLLETQADARELISTSLAARAAGSKLPGTGVTAFPASDLTLATNEVYLGKGVQSITSDLRKEHKRRFIDIASKAPQDLKEVLRQYADLFGSPREVFLDERKRQIVYRLRHLQRAIDEQRPAREILGRFKALMKASEDLAQESKTKIKGPRERFKEIVNKMIIQESQQGVAGQVETAQSSLEMAFRKAVGNLPQESRKESDKNKAPEETTKQLKDIVKNVLQTPEETTKRLQDTATDVLAKPRLSEEADKSRTPEEATKRLQDIVKDVLQAPEETTKQLQDTTTNVLPKAKETTKQLQDIVKGVLPKPRLSKETDGSKAPEETTKRLQDTTTNVLPKAKETTKRLQDTTTNVLPKPRLSKEAGRDKVQEETTKRLQDTTTNVLPKARLSKEAGRSKAPEETTKQPQDIVKKVLQTPEETTKQPQDIVKDVLPKPRLTKEADKSKTPEETTKRLQDTTTDVLAKPRLSKEADKNKTPEETTKRLQDIVKDVLSKPKMADVENVQTKEQEDTSRLKTPEIEEPSKTLQRETSEKSKDHKQQQRRLRQNLKSLARKLLGEKAIRQMGGIERVLREEGGPDLVGEQRYEDAFLVRRSGAPFMMSAGTAMPLYYQAEPWKDAAKDQIAPPQKRMATAALLPMVSSWWRDQGDVDGDAYQFLRTSLDQMREQFLQEAKAALEAPEGEREGRIAFLESLGIRMQEEIEKLRQVPEETEEMRFWRTTKSNLDTSSPIYQAELARQKRAGRKTFSIRQARIHAEERARFGELLDFTVGWLGLPREVAQHLTPAEAQAMTTLFRAPLADLDGSRERTMAALERGEKAQKILKFIKKDQRLRQAWTGKIESIEPHIPYLEEKLPEVKGQVRSLLSEVLRHDYPELDPSNLDQLIKSYKAFSAAGRAAAAEGIFNAFQKLMAKGMGTYLDEEQLMGVEAAIGTAGGSLLGPTFNILTPAAMDVFQEMVYAEALKNPSFVQTLQEQIASLPYSRERQELLAELQDPERASLEARNRFTVVRDTIASLQTLLREAIKSRGERGLAAEVVTPFEINGITATLAEHLKRDDIDRAEVLNRFISRTMGPELGGEYGLTGLGALHLLHRYTSVDDNSMEELEEYARSLGAQVDENIETTIADTLNRTVASFRASRFGDHTQKALDILNQLPPTPEIEAARRRIQEQNLTGTAALTEYLLEEVRRSGVFTPETVRGLRETAIYRRKAKLDLEDAEGEAQRIDTVVTNTTTVLLSLLQRANQLDPNTLMSGTFGLYSAFEQARLRLNERLARRPLPEEGGVNTLRKAILSSPEVSKKLAQASTAYAVMHGLAAEIAALEEMAASSYDNREAIRERIHILRSRLQDISQDEFAYQRQVDPKIKAYAARTEEDIQRLTTPQALEAQKQLEQAVKVMSENKSREMLDIKSIVGQPNNLIDVLLGPGLIALASGGIGLDERGLLFGIDVLQSLAMSPTFQSWQPSETAQQLREAAGRLGMPKALAESLVPEWVGKPGTDPANLVARLRMGRVRGVLSSSETTLGGAFRAMLQESLIAGAGTVIHSGVSKLLGENTFGKAVAEVASTLAVLSASRSFAARVVGSPPVPDFVERMLREFATQVWMAVEQVQLFLNSAEGLLYDEETETTIDFDTEAFPGQVSEGLETGLIVVDPEDNVLQSQGDPFLAGMYETVESARNSSALAP